MNSFQELSLPPRIAENLIKLGFLEPTPIQSQAVPIVLSKRDLIGIAQTGTGKTGAFSIPLLIRLHKLSEKMALVLVPTRELAIQIDTFWKSLTQGLPEIQSAALIGGMSMQGQIQALRKKPRLVVATPGRLVDHLNRGTVILSKTEVLVLDEADRMLDMGFAPQLTQILRFLPKVRQTLLFSATWSSSMNSLAAKYLKDPVRVSVGTSQVVTRIQQSVLAMVPQNKNEALLDQINQSGGAVLVFARTQARTDRVARYLSEYGLEVNRIHGGRTQAQRNSALENFRSGRIKILVATDIAARGIDVSAIHHVINYDLPQAPEDYVHRLGRTARAGASGFATSFITPEDRNQWRNIVVLLKKSGSLVPEPKKWMSLPL